MPGTGTSSSDVDDGPHREFRSVGEDGIYPMLILLSALVSTLCSMFRSRAALELEHMALRHQIGVLKRSGRKRPKLTAADRLFWVFLSRVWATGARRWTS